MRNISIILVLAIGVLAVPDRVVADPLGELVLLTENYAPFNCSKNGKIQGTSVELLLKMFKRAESSKTVEGIKA